MVRWMLSTMIAGIVGLAAIGTVLYASMQTSDKNGTGGFIAKLQSIGSKALTPFKPLLVNRQTGPRFIGPKSDRLMVTSKGLFAQNIIQDTYARKRENRQYLIIKPYTLMTSSFATARPDASQNIPAFDPYKLYATPKHSNNAVKGKKIPIAPLVTTHMLPLALSIGKGDDSFILSNAEAQILVAIAAEDYFPAPNKTKDQDETLAVAEKPPSDLNSPDIAPKNTTIIKKQINHRVAETDETQQFEKTVRSGDSMNTMLRGAGAENWQSAQIIAAMNKIYQASALKVGQKLRFVTAPKPTDPGKSEPVEVSLYSGKKHLVTVTRTEAGTYVASDKPGKNSFHGRRNSYPRRATLYQSFYSAGLSQKLPRDTILKLLRIHAFDTDFKRTTQAGDNFEAFFDMRENKEKFENVPNELLYTSITVNGRKRAFFRFRTPDGRIDYYDRSGKNAKKFLMRKPVRGNRIRLASGFGYRMHPVLKVRKLHTGTDWAGPTGTPILAAGDGTVVFAGRKGGYGNYIRIRHANGYQTAYAHQHHFAKGMKVGLRVRQGQIIGYIGTTGRSTGPHLHFEVLVNNKFVNAMTIPVPRGRILQGYLLAKFKKERDRISELMSRDPVTTRVASVK